MEDHSFTINELDPITFKGVPFPTKKVLDFLESSRAQVESMEKELRQSQAEAVHYQNLCLGGKDKVENHEYIQALKDKEKENKALRENWENLREWMKGKQINFSGDDRFWRGYQDFYYDVKAKLKELEEA